VTKLGRGSILFATVDLNHRNNLDGGRGLKDPQAGKKMCCTAIF